MLRFGFSDGKKTVIGPFGETIQQSEADCTQSVASE
jgi:hypothetical protein